MSICIEADESKPIPRPVLVTHTCNGCGITVRSILPPGDTPQAMAKAAGFVCGDSGHHWCQGCAKGEREVRVEQMELF